MSGRRVFSLIIAIVALVLPHAMAADTPPEQIPLSFRMHQIMGETGGDCVASTPLGDWLDAILHDTSGNVTTYLRGVVLDTWSSLLGKRSFDSLCATTVSLLRLRRTHVLQEVPPGHIVDDTSRQACVTAAAILGRRMAVENIQPCLRTYAKAAIIEGLQLPDPSP